MSLFDRTRTFPRRAFLKALFVAAAGLFRYRGPGSSALAQTPNPHTQSYLPVVYASHQSELYLVRNIAAPNFTVSNRHPGVERLLALMGTQGLKFYQRATADSLSGPDGLIARNDVVLIKINGQWKYRGCTNSDVLRGVIQRILDHPDGFAGEIVVFENGQGRGSLDCNQTYEDNSVRANAENRLHSFNYVIKTVFAGRPVSGTLLDASRLVTLNDNDHTHVGYRAFRPHPDRSSWTISYPCFNTAQGRRIELAKGLWTGSGHTRQGLKLINLPVLKTHGGCGVTGALKLFYGVLSMNFSSAPYHYGGIGSVLGEMMAHVWMPDLNIMDAIWVSHAALNGAPTSNPSHQNTLLASVDPVALDYWAGKHIMYPVSGNPDHHPDMSDQYADSNFSQYLDAAAVEINSCLPAGRRPVTRDESSMRCWEA